MPTFLTERLVLRPFELADAPTVETLAGDEDVARTTFIPHPYPKGAAAHWIESGHQAMEQGTGYPLAMRLRLDNQLVGCMSLLISPEHQRGTLAYWVGRPYWGQGYATEAARRVVAFGFDELHLHRIGAAALHRNRASTRVMEKAGLQCEGTLRDDLLHWGVFEDVDYYGLLQRDYLACR
ncbi:MAG: GNAT family N-acetyltransferase [Chloroflexi bacterium]|nr:MAG: GNAT family N-acetyltransferase [Chloroflexota bacterium]